MITANIETITPGIAKKYLEANTQNYRNLNRSRMLCYASEMSAGCWQINGEPIIFDEEGTLKDGQHRLAAILYSGETLPIMVVRGVPKGANAYDIGASRSQTQIAHAEGVPVDTSLLGAVNILVCRQKAISAPKTVAIDYVRNHFELLNEAYSIARTGTNHAIGKKSSIIIAIYVFRRLEMFSKDDLKTYFNIFNTSNPAGYTRELSPVFVAIKQILSLTKNGRQQQIMQSEIITLSMQDFVNGQQRIKQYKTDGNNFSKLLNKVCDLDGIARYENK